MIDKSKAVLNEEGNARSFLISLAGKDYHCQCGCNCFHKPDKTNKSIYRCNGCGTTYADMSKG